MFRSLAKPFVCLPLIASLHAPLFAATNATAATTAASPDEQSPSVARILNADFETGTLAGWKDWRLRRAEISTNAHAGQHAVALGPESARCVQVVKIKPNSRYRLSGWVKTDSGAEQVELLAQDYGGPTISVASAVPEYTKVSLEFTSAHTANSVTISLWHRSGPGIGYADSLELEYLGVAPPPIIQEFITPAFPEPKSEGGVTTLPPEDMQWYLDAKFGMFVHWGVYSAIDKGAEWVMHTKPYTPEEYRKRAEDPVNGFTASKFNPAEWAALAKSAGMKYTVLTTRHHDGYALFASKHPNSWTSVQQLGRDLIKEYTDAIRSSGLYVGLYYSPMSWRYPGYYNVTGKNMKPNKWGYTSEPWHPENARVMKEEVYEQLSLLLSTYGPISYMFWDGGYLGQSVDRPLEDRFWDTGQYQDPNGDWIVGDAYVERDPASGKALGVMGLVRKHQPKMIVNERFGWVGDVHGEEGSAATTGNIRTENYMEKCMSVQKGGWGYVPDAKVHPFEDVAVYLSDCVVRNINLLLNVAPDRHGAIPESQQEVLRRTGQWLEKVGAAVYNTRGGPWQPMHGEFGFTYSKNNIYCHIYAGYRHRDTGTFTTQSLGTKQVSKVLDLYSGKELAWKRNENNTLTIEGVDYTQTPYVTILQLVLKQNVYEN